MLKDKLFLLKHYTDKFQLTLKHILVEKLLELFCIGNDFAKYSAKFRNLFIILFCTL